MSIDLDTTVDELRKLAARPRLADGWYVANYVEYEDRREEGAGTPFVKPTFSVTGPARDKDGDITEVTEGVRFPVKIDSRWYFTDKTVKMNSQRLVALWPDAPGNFSVTDVLDGAISNKVLLRIENSTNNGKTYYEVASVIAYKKAADPAADTEAEAA